MQSLIGLFDRPEIFVALAILISSSFVVVAIQKCVIACKLSARLAFMLHFLWMLTFFSLSNVTLIVMKWPFVPTGTFLMELMILCMKMHSYLWVNRRLHFDPDSVYHKPPSGSLPVNYPDNVSVKNFAFFLLAPTLVYELSYPRTKKIRISYILGKMFSFATVVAFFHVLFEMFITPKLNNTEIGSLEVIADLILPFLLCDLLLFYLLFDVICNAFAELTRFADRNFYDDWWNSTTFEEYARRWNKPVHEWLLRHVYLYAIDAFRTSRFTASIITFFISSVLHEYFLGMFFGIFRPWIFVLQMCQVPLIELGRGFRGTRLGNVFFWVSICLGIPLMATLYCREYYIKQSDKNAFDYSTVEAFLLLVVPSMILAIGVFVAFRCARNRKRDQKPIEKQL